MAEGVVLKSDLTNDHPPTQPLWKWIVTQQPLVDHIKILNLDL
jgi:hypothetical protein